MATFKKITNTNYVPNHVSPDLSHVEKYLNDRLDELADLANRGDPWVFGACSTYIEMLAFRVYYSRIITRNGPTRNQATGADYIELCNGYLYPRRKNSVIRYSNGDEVKFTDQLYYILRCGVVHTFSMNPTPRNPNTAKPYSIILGHAQNFKSTKTKHLQKIKIDQASGSASEEAVLIFAEDFVDDLKKCTKKIIQKAKKDCNLRNGILRSFETHPSFGWNLYSKM